MANEQERTRRIRELNDKWRIHRQGNGKFMVTAGIDALGPEFMILVNQAVQTFNDFTEDNDPYGEQDFGSFEIGDEKLFFKIDYYDLDLKYGSEDPADEHKTCRVLTVMLRSEY